MKPIKTITKKFILILFMISVTLFQGCSSLVDEKEEERITNFQNPTNGKSGIYVYRHSFVASWRHANILLDNKIVANISGDDYVYISTDPGIHTITAQRTILPIDFLNFFSDLTGLAVRIKTEPNTNYYIEFEYPTGKLNIKTYEEAMDEIDDSDFHAVYYEGNKYRHNEAPLTVILLDPQIISNQYLTSNDITITTNDLRPFNDSGVIDPDKYFIDPYRIDTKENREKTVGYMFTVLGGLANVTTEDKLENYISSLIHKEIQNKKLANLDITANIQELWLSSLTRREYINLVPSERSNKQLATIYSAGYRYKIDVLLKDKISGDVQKIECANKDYKDGKMEVSSEDIKKIYSEMISNFSQCLINKIN